MEDFQLKNQRLPQEIIEEMCGKVQETLENKEPVIILTRDTCLIGGVKLDLLTMVVELLTKFEDFELDAIVETVKMEKGLNIVDEN